MTTANKITIGRILLTPLFVLFSVYYGRGVQAGEPQESLRLAAVLVFLVAAASDALDGFIARRFNQGSALGVVLDPIADKALLLTALITLSFSNWEHSLPPWFPVLVIARDAVVLAGTALLHYLNGKSPLQVSRSGKIATALQMTAIAWVLLQFPHSEYIVWAAGAFTFISGAGYVAEGVRMLQTGEHTDA